LHNLHIENLLLFQLLLSLSLIAVTLASKSQLILVPRTQLTSLLNNQYNFVKLNDDDGNIHTNLQNRLVA
jgi:hypothetical protein